MGLFVKPHLVLLRQCERIILTFTGVCVCVFYLAEFWQTYVNSGPEAGAQVGGTCEDVAKMLVPHKFPPSFLDQLLHLLNKKKAKTPLMHRSLSRLRVPVV